MKELRKIAIVKIIRGYDTNKETGLGLSSSEASKEIEIWVNKNKQDIPLK